MLNEIAFTAEIKGVKMKIKLILFTLLLFLLIPALGVSGKEDAGDLDGTTWTSWDFEEKVFYLSGFLSASWYIVEENKEGLFYSKAFGSTEYNAETSSKIWGDFSATEKKKKSSFTRSDVAILLDSQRINKNDSLSKYSIYGITTGQIFQGLNLFYDDFKNRQIKLPVAIYVIKKQITGASAEEIEALVQWLRGSGQDFNKRFYIDKEGIKKFIVFP